MSLRTSIVLALGLSFAGGAHAQSASDALDAAWITACASATPGTNFFARCEEILNAGPGSGGRRSAAAIGNNLELFASQARALKAMARARAKGASRAREAGEEEEAGWSAGFDDSNGQVETLAEGSRWALLGSLAHVETKRAESDFERGFDDSGVVLLLGLDYRFSDRWGGLVALQRESRDARFGRNSGALSSDTDLLSAGLSYSGDHGFGAGLTANVGRVSSDLRREINYTLVLNQGTPQENTVTIISRSRGDSTARQFGAEFNAGWERGVGAWTWRYGGDASWQRTIIGRTDERNDLGLDFQIRAQRITSLQAGLSVETARTFSSAGGVWQPYVRLRWLREFRDDPRLIDARFRGGDNVIHLRFSTDEPDRNFGEFGLGVMALFPGGWQAYGSWQRLLGHRFMDDDRFDLGFRREF